MMDRTYDEWVSMEDYRAMRRRAEVAEKHSGAVRSALWAMQLTATQAMKLPLAERLLLMERSANELAEEGDA